MKYSITGITGEFFELFKNKRSFTTVSDKTYRYSFSTVYEINDYHLDLLGMIIENMQKVEKKYADHQ